MARLTSSRLAAGVWHGELAGRPPERLMATHLGRALEGLQVDRHESGASLHLPVPADMVSDGVQTCLIADAGTGETVASFTLVAGQPLAEDLRAEVETLRAEMELLKSILRRMGGAG
ncbi:hypothetical protein [Pseudoroseicyclus tamaricis]|uniref:Uncharacterized protein n=1 Tax=Pseudoroseicyclus tamaricis TaxID=2705421 RepID=A0A6B2JZG8_9RHOB|nr:hypothetical protein [Pseudoroseicyclus tamaricis]NDU99515.1 hypothetical protein [Pseudoroseicyclus tamaricis]